NEPTFSKAKLTVGVGKAHNEFLRSEGLSPDRKRGGTCKSCPQLEHGHFLRVGARDAEDAGGKRRPAFSLADLDLPPVCDGEMHGLGNMRRGYDQSRGEEPTGTSYSEHGRRRPSFLLAEMARDADGGLDERRRIDA